MTRKEIAELRSKDFFGDYFFVLKQRLDEANAVLNRFAKLGRRPNQDELLDWEMAKFDAGHYRRLIYKE